MSNNVDAANVTRRRFLAVAGSVAATSSLVPSKDSTLFAATPPPMPVADYPVTIDVADPRISNTVRPRKVMRPPWIK